MLRWCYRYDNIIEGNGQLVYYSVVEDGNGYNSTLYGYGTWQFVVFRELLQS